MTDKILVLATAGSEEEAKELARELVKRRLAACVNIAPRVSSIYLWRGKIEESEEYLLIIKTRAESFARVRQCIEELHSYDLPECLAIPITDGSAAYLNWIAESLRP
jgi:periplasmic divalent cation tolerance protein